VPILPGGGSFREWQRISAMLARRDPTPGTVASGPELAYGRPAIVAAPDDEHRDPVQGAAGSSLTMMNSLMPSLAPRSSPIARAACGVYALLVVYAGLTPWSGWEDRGISAFAYLTAPLPQYITTFDLLVNVLAYIPLGALLVFALYPRIRGLQAFVIATLAGVLLSAATEAMQTFLPTRISSNLDLLTNSLGAAAGAALAVLVAPALIDRGRLLQSRRRWFENHATVLLLAVALWPTAQIYPRQMLFGNGELRGMLEPVVTALGGAWWQFDTSTFGPAEFALAEAFVVAAALLAVGLGLTSVLQPRAPRLRLLLALVAAALISKSVANGVQFGPERMLAWITPGVIGGGALGLLALATASGGPRLWQARMAAVALVALLVAVNITPDNPYYLAQLAQWRPGKLLNFNALAEWVSALWPLLLGAGLALRRVPA